MTGAPAARGEYAPRVRSWLAALLVATSTSLACGARTSLDVCLGGACTGEPSSDAAVPDGACPSTSSGPLVLASGLDDPGDIALRDGVVYWIDSGDYDHPDGAILAMPLCGGTIRTLAARQTNPSGLTVDATQIFWSAGQTSSSAVLLRAPRAGGAFGVLATDYPPSGGIALDGTSLVYTVWIGTAVIATLPVAGGLGRVIVPGQDLASNVAVDADAVYWTVPYYLKGTVNRVPFAGGATTTLAAGRNSPRTLVVDGTSVYWTESANDSGAPQNVMRVPITGGAATTVASDQSGLGGLALDTTHLFWSNTTSVVMLPLAGGSATTIAARQSGPASIAVDGKHAVWSSSGFRAHTGAIVRVDY